MILFLVPPSEGKIQGGSAGSATRHFSHQCLSYPEIPFDAPLLPAIQRYTGVVYQSWDYQTMTPQGKIFADRHCVIVSAMWGLLGLHDMIPWYTYPVTGACARQWRPLLTDYLGGLPITHCVSVLPASYHAMIDRDSLPFSWTKVDFVTSSGALLGHRGKKAKGLWLRNLCEGWYECDYSRTHISIVSS